MAVLVAILADHLLPGLLGRTRAPPLRCGRLGVAGAAGGSSFHWGGCGVGGWPARLWLLERRRVWRVWVYLAHGNSALHSLCDARCVRLNLSVSCNRVSDTAACRFDFPVVYGSLSVESVAVASAFPVPDISG